MLKSDYCIPEVFLSLIMAVSSDDKWVNEKLDYLEISDETFTPC